MWIAKCRKQLSLSGFQTKGLIKAGAQVHRGGTIGRIIGQREFTANA